MTKTIRKLLGYLLVACLLLSGVSALAETGDVIVHLGINEAKKFTKPEGVVFELFLVGNLVDTGTTWEPAEGFSSVDLMTKKPADGSGKWSDDEAKAILGQVEAVLKSENPPKPIKLDNTIASGYTVFKDLKPGMYYIRKAPDTSPKLLKVSGSLVAIPSFGADDPYAPRLEVKFDFDTPPEIDVPVSKLWDDDDDFDELRPVEITARLHRYVLGDLKEDESFVCPPILLNAENDWSGVWKGLPATNDDGVDYEYRITEDDVDHYAGYVLGNELTNRHTPSYGGLEVTKSVKVDGKDTTGTLADGRYHFTLTGPAEYPKSKNYLNNYDFYITITGGKSSTWSHDRLKPGTYTIKEDTANLPAGMSLLGDEAVTVEVKPYKRAKLTAEEFAAQIAKASFVNNQVTGSLKIVKQVTVANSNTSNTTTEASYSFNVKGPSYPDGEVVSIKVVNGKSNSAQLDNLLPGEYEVTEIKTNLPSGVTYVSGDEKKTLKVTHTAQNPLTFTFTNNFVPTVTPTPTPTPTPRTTTPPQRNPDRTPTPTPVPTPTPEPVVEISGTKTWSDDSNAHGTRPSSITVQLLRNGEKIREMTVSGKGDKWGYRFGSLPKLDEKGNAYTYTVREVKVAGYTTRVSGTNITNSLIPQTPRQYTNLSGRKIWRDSDNADGLRPTYIVVRLMRNGEEVDHRTVTAANGWQYSFQNLPVDDGYGNKYNYTITEDPVEGYVVRTNGLNLTNSMMPNLPEGQDFDDLNVEDLEDMIELFDYDTPLWGRPLKTGDELPIYPIVFGGIGGAALIALIVLIVVNKKRKGKAA